VVASSQTHRGYTDLDGAGGYASRGHPAGQQKCVPVELAAGEQPLTGCSYGGRLGQSDGSPLILGTSDCVLRVHVGRAGVRPRTEAGRHQRGMYASLPGTSPGWVTTTHVLFLLYDCRVKDPYAVSMQVFRVSSPY